MGQRFQWRSVLQYDTEYRKAQADAGFDFGADSSYLMQVFLRDGLTPKPHSAAKDSVHPKQSMTLLVAGQFVGNSIPPRVVPRTIANSPMFAALASSPIVTTPINPNVPRPQCPMPPLLQKTGTKHNFARPVTPIAKTSGCMGALVGWWLRPWFHPTLCEVWCFPHWSWQMPGAYPPCISAQWPLSYHRSSVPTCHSADTRWTGKR